MINIPLSFVGKAKQAPLLIVGKRKLDHFAIFNWKGCLEAPYTTRMSTSVLSYSLLVTGVPVRHLQSSELLQKHRCFSREGPALFSPVSFLGFLEKMQLAHVGS